MTADVEWIRAGDSCSEAARRLAQRNVGLLVVEPDQKPASGPCCVPVGVLTDRNLVVRVLGQGHDGASTPVRDAMTPAPLASVPLTATLSDAEQAMAQHGVRRLLVLSPDGGVAGVLSVDDLAMTGSIRRAGEALRDVKPDEQPKFSPMQPVARGAVPVVAAAAAPSAASVSAVPAIVSSSHYVGQIMHAPVECVGDHESCREAAMRMAKRSVGFLPVCARVSIDEAHVCGVLTDRDLVVRLMACDLDPDTTDVREVMTRRVVCCSTADNVAEAQRLMMAENVRRLPVIHPKSHTLVGLLSVDDIAKRAGADRAGEVLRSVAQHASFTEGIEG
jgi:CBS domain-containing protein